MTFDSQISHQLPYRVGVNALILNKNRYLLVQLQEYKENEWKFIGGGVEENEEPLEAAFREILEEVNITKKDLQLVGESKHVHQYDFPVEMKGSIKKRFKGQLKHQFVFRFSGKKEDIFLQKEELKNIKWVEFLKLKKHLTFPNQYDNILKIILEFDLPRF